MSTLKDELGRRLKAWRLSQGLSQVALDTQLGHHRDKVLRLEHGKGWTVEDVETFMRLCGWDLWWGVKLEDSDIEEK